MALSVTHGEQLTVALVILSQPCTHTCGLRPVYMNKRGGTSMFLVSREADPQTDEYHTELELESQPAAQVLWGALEGFSSHPGKNEDTAVFSLRKS